MDIRLEVDWIKKELDNISDPSLIEAIKEMLLGRSTMVSESRAEYIKSYNEDLDKSEKEIESGEFFNEDEVLELIKKWK